MTSPETAAVKRGAKLLDTFVPKWANKIDLDTLDMGRVDVCVLGQVHGEFSRGLQELATAAICQRLATTKLHTSRAIELDGTYYGFNTDGADEDYHRLGQQWVREITRRTAPKRRAK